MNNNVLLIYYHTTIRYRIIIIHYTVGENWSPFITISSIFDMNNDNNIWVGQNQGTNPEYRIRRHTDTEYNTAVYI
mgnify:CR=1 FL=1